MRRRFGRGRRTGNANGAKRAPVDAQAWLQRIAEAELTKKQKKGFAKMMKSKDEVDLRPSLVRAAVRAGGDDAIRVLKSGFAAAENGSLLQTWIAVGLLELGDTSQIGLCKAALNNPEWAFTAVRIARALAANGDFSGIPVLARLYGNAAKGVEMGAGFDCVTQPGTEHRDEITPEGFLSNHAGGVLGGISSGQDILVSTAFKPTSSLRLPCRGIDIDGNEVEIVTKGRHDPCVGIRATPIVEAMMALVLMDHVLRHRAQNG